MAGGENREENYPTKSHGGVASAAAPAAQNSLAMLSPWLSGSPEHAS